MSKERKLAGQLNAVITLIALVAITSLGFIPILFAGLLKLIPIRRWQSLCTQFADRVATLWWDFNIAYITRTQQTAWQIDGLENLNRKNWYLIIANHQSWLDILVLVRVFNRKIPTLKFFIKDQLKWVPLLGFAWWAMGCPFMKRYSKAYLEKNPHKKGKDLQATRKAVELFKHSPTAIMNFVEGTRYTEHKKQQQQSSYQHLLKPKAGGISFVISAMGQQFDSLLDVTIIYPEEQHSLWDFLCRRVKSIKVHIRQLPIPSQFTNSSLVEDDKIQLEFRNWLNDNWLEKDNLIARQY